MRTTPVLLGVSLAVNIGLALAVYARWQGASAGPEAMNSGPPANERAALGASSTAGTESGSGNPGAAAAATALRNLAALDDESYVAELRARGFPSDVIRMLVELRLRQRYAERIKRSRRLREYAYWRSWGGYEAFSAEERAAARAISSEIAAEAKRLLGDAGALLSPYQKARLAPTLGFLSPEKIQQVDAINNDYNELIAQVRERTRGLVLRADREELRMLEREQRADLAALFTPEELLEYDLRASPTASALRNRMTYFEPTEEEYRALVKIQLELDQQFGSSNLSADEQVAKRAAEQAIPARFAEALGPERYAEFQLTTDGGFRQTLAFLRNAGLDLPAAKEVIAVKRDVVQRADAIQKQRELSAAQRTEALAALEQEALQRLKTQLGEPTLAEFRRTAGVDWLSRLRPREAPANP